jgi:hypothetical protein
LYCYRERRENKVQKINSFLCNFIYNLARVSYLSKWSTKRLVSDGYSTGRLNPFLEGIAVMVGEFQKLYPVIILHRDVTGGH